jgi:hypothetical protein
MPEPFHVEMLCLSQWCPHQLVMKAVRSDNEKDLRDIPLTSEFASLFWPTANEPNICFSVN